MMSCTKLKPAQFWFIFCLNLLPWHLSLLPENSDIIFKFVDPENCTIHGKILDIMYRSAIFAYFCNTNELLTLGIQLRENMFPAFVKHVSTGVANFDEFEVRSITES